MTEAEWLNFSGLRDADAWQWNDGGRDRKLFLFATACCRRIFPLLPDQRSRLVVEVAERVIEGTASWKELEVAGEAVHDDPYNAYTMSAHYAVDFLAYPPGNARWTVA